LKFIRSLRSLRSIRIIEWLMPEWRRPSALSNCRSNGLQQSLKCGLNGSDGKKRIDQLVQID
jgi:hypothetical protein